MVKIICFFLPSVLLQRAWWFVPCISEHPPMKRFAAWFHHQAYGDTRGSIMTYYDHLWPMMIWWGGFKDVIFFETCSGWWSPGFGYLQTSETVYKFTIYIVSLRASRYSFSWAEGFFTTGGAGPWSVWSAKECSKHPNWSLPWLTLHGATSKSSWRMWAMPWVSWIPG